MKLFSIERRGLLILIIMYACLSIFFLLPSTPFWTILPLGIAGGFVSAICGERDKLMREKLRNSHRKRTPTKTTTRRKNK